MKKNGLYFKRINITVYIQFNVTFKCNFFLTLKRVDAKKKKILQVFIDKIDK